VKIFAELWEKTRALELKTQSLEREIVERRRVERELLAANQELESFSYSVSHDLRTPLRAMAGLSQALIEDYRDRPLDDTGRDYAERIIRASRQMDALIEDLLAFSRLGRERVLLVPVDLSSLLSELLTRLDMGNGRVGIEGALPPVQGNPVLLSQVFMNLFTNAAKFVRPGIEPKITLRADTRGRKTRIWVEDNGIGIAPEHHDRIFRVFERLNDSRVYPGTGIGLAIVRRAMEKMKGRVGVESDLGKGSRFWVELSHAGNGVASDPVAELAQEKDRPKA
jgi:signal transduction histidine kinase